MWAETLLHLMSLLVGLKSTALFDSRSPFPDGHLNMKAVKQGRGKGNRHIRTNTGTAIKASRIPVKSLSIPNNFCGQCLEGF